MQRYTMLGQVGDGAFGIVSKAQHQNTGEIVAVKRMKQRFQTWEECLQLREILSLRRLQHTNIIKLKEVVRESTELFLIFEFMEGNVYNVQKSRTEQMGSGSAGVFNEKEIRCIMAQVILGLQSVHKGGFMHRDLKPENLLIKGDIVKLADFGLAKEIRSRPPFTEYVSTRWYRAPEIVLRSTHYNSPIDIWAAGVIFAELYLNRALLPGSSDSDQLFKICSVLGTPSMSDWDEGYQLARKLNVRFPSVCAPSLRQQIPNASNDAISLIEMMLRFNPSERPTASQCLQHPFFCQSLGPTEQMSSHFQGITSGMPHNPFAVGAGPQLPGSSTTPAGGSTPISSNSYIPSHNFLNQNQNNNNNTQMMGASGFAGGGTSQMFNNNNNNAQQQQQQNNNNNNNNIQRSNSVHSQQSAGIGSSGGGSSNMPPPPPNVIGASAHRQSPLGRPMGNTNNNNNYNQFGGGIPARATNSPIGSYHPSFGGNNNNNNNQQPQRSGSVSSNPGGAGGGGYGGGGYSNNNANQRSGSVGQQQQQNNNNNFGASGLNSYQQQQQQQGGGGGIVGSYGRRPSPLGGGPMNSGLAPFGNHNNMNQNNNNSASSMNPATRTSGSGLSGGWGSGISTGSGGGGVGGMTHPSFGGNNNNTNTRTSGSSFGEDQY